MNYLQKKITDNYKIVLDNLLYIQRLAHHGEKSFPASVEIKAIKKVADSLIDKIRFNGNHDDKLLKRNLKRIRKEMGIKTKRSIKIRKFFKVFVTILIFLYGFTGMFLFLLQKNIQNYQIGFILAGFFALIIVFVFLDNK